MKNYITVDGKDIPIEGEKNLLEVIRKAGIDIPTFCYHSELSVYGACRLCFVQVEGRGIVPSCSTPPEGGMKIKTSTEEIRQMRRIAVELLLANHEQSCPTCEKSSSCQLQSLARRLGVNKVRFKSTMKHKEIDMSNPSIVRDVNKCILCGDCVRMCSEIQGIGAIDFANRGSEVMVLPAFGKSLGQVECVYCGQCASVCPTGALTIKSEKREVWKALDNPSKKVVAQIAPAVRVALGEYFGLEAGVITTGQIAAALKHMGFARVYDTSFAADLTVIEESTEFIKREEKGDKLPQFTSCCPAWVKFAEQYYPELLTNLSSCRSPQQMFGSLAKEILPDELSAEKENIVVVSFMPCSAKKFEARREEFQKNGIKDVDYVITTQELGQMIEESGLDFKSLQPESLDMPMGFKTGAGVIFGNSGGVSEAVLRYVAEKLGGVKLDRVDFYEVRGEEGLREANIKIGDKTVKLAVISGLKNARTIIGKIKEGLCYYDLIEVMACPGGCIGGAGQPVSRDIHAKKKRTKSIYDADKMLELHKSQENPYIKECYDRVLEEAGSSKAHSLLHTCYHSRKRIAEESIPLIAETENTMVEVKVCLGTGCYLRGAQDLIYKLAGYIEDHDLLTTVDLKGTFCFESCDRGPVVSIGDTVVEHCNFKEACSVMEEKLKSMAVAVNSEQ
ncbi:MAG: [FeFe] hydrogenase, group A [Candidatus Eremiobacterota bacterium]